MLAWLGAAAVLATAVVTLRQAQPTVDRDADPTPPPPRPVQVARFVADGVVLPEPAEPPAAVPLVEASRTGPGRLRVAWGDALPGGTRPDHAAGYEVRWRATDGDGEGQRLVVTPELELDGAAVDGGAVIEVRSVNAYGRRSAPTVTSVPASSSPASLTPGPVVDPRRFTGLAEPFDGPFSVDGSVLAARWHLSGYPGCTRADTDDGMLFVDLACGADVAVLRARAPLRLPPSGSGSSGLSSEPSSERGRVVVVTDGAGPRSSLSIDLVPGPADRIGVERTRGAGPVDPALPDGTIRVLIDDTGVRVLSGPGVPRVSPPPMPPPAATRGVGVLHVFEVVLDDSGVWVLQDGIAVGVSGVVPPWTEAHLLVGMSGPDGQQARVRIDAIGLTGPPSMGPLTYTHPVVLATQRVLGTAEPAPGIGISRERLAGARSARLVATVRTAPGVDLGGLTLQQGDGQSPARPLVTVPGAPGADVTVVADLLPQVLGPDGPAAVSPLVLRAPGAESTVVPITDSYLDIVPLSDKDLPSDAGPGQRVGRPPETALPPLGLTILDSDSREVSTVAAGSRVVVEVELDGIAGQLDGERLAGIAGFQLWLSGRLIAGVPTAIDGAGVGGVFRIAVSTGALPPGRQSLELRLIADDPTISPSSALTSWHQS